MSSELDKVAKNIVQTLREFNNKGTSPYDTQGIVTRVEGDVAWVHFPNGIDETPVQLTTSAKKGDAVQVRVSGGSAWLYGNATNPPTDDTRAIEADKKAVQAKYIAVDAAEASRLAEVAAKDALSSSVQAKQAADTAYQYAGEAKVSADDAKVQAQNSETEAQKAANSARNANNYARNALSSLADIEDVVDVLGWVSEHGTYSLTTDTQVDSSKSYYKLTPAGTYERVPIPVSTVLKDMYELITVYSYTKTTDTQIDSSKTYYIYDSSTGTYTAVVSPVVADIDQYYERQLVATYYELTKDTTPVSGKTYYAYDFSNDTYTAATPTSTIGTYYELSIDESVRNYILTHISLTNEGLAIVNDDSSYRMIIGSDSIQLKNSLGAVVASYSSEITLGEAANGIRNVITATRMSFRTDAGDIAYFGLNEDGIWQMHISTTYVDDMIRFGDYAWIKRNNGNMSIKWLGA